MLEEFKKKIIQEFEFDLGNMRYFLGVQVKQFKGGIIISQEKYVDDLLKNFHMENCKPVASPLTMKEKLQQDEVLKKWIQRCIEVLLVY